jgi:Cysteine-rich secretory protein family
MTRAVAAIVLCGLVMGVAAFVIYRENSPRSPVQATFYQDLAQADAVVDPAAAQSMISGYRSNNGPGSVIIEADLMRLASEQARAMAARFAVENVGAGYHTLADAFSGWRDSPPHRANMLNRSVTRMGIAAAYAPASKYKVFWALIFAGSDGRRG